MNLLTILGPSRVRINVCRLFHWYLSLCDYKSQLELQLFSDIASNIPRGLESTAALVESL